MTENLYIVALIPARSGSKSIIDKNIKPYKGKPLLVHSINIGLDCSYIQDVFVSTDSCEYSTIAKKYGSKLTPLRPKNISNDLSPDIDTFYFFLNWLKESHHKIPDIIVHLRPTYPNRRLDVLDECIEYFLENYDSYDSLRTVIPMRDTPYKMYHINQDSSKKPQLRPYFTKYADLKEPFNQARQNFPQTYLHNGYIDIVKTSVILEQNLLSGTKILPYIMKEEENDDIDEIDDFIKSEALVL